LADHTLIDRSLYFSGDFSRGIASTESLHADIAPHPIAYGSGKNAGKILGDGSLKVGYALLQDFVNPKRLP
jgi:hypothetical protein